MMNINWCGSEKNDGIDRISSLPDDVLTHILSFLNTRKAAQTCILSKRWTNTWASVPHLEFDIEEFGLPNSVDDAMAVEFVTKFELLVKSVLEKRETFCVNRFKLWLDSDSYWPWTQAFADCISDAMKLEPRECLIEVGSCENLNLNTDLIFTCASIIDLELSLWTKVDPHFVAIEPNSVNLPFLKTLNLDGVTMRDDSLKKLFLGCPVVEKLEMTNCYIGIIEICSNTLKKLVLHSCNNIMRVQISMLNLQYLDIFVGTREILLVNMSSLVDAYIYLPGWHDQDNYITRGPELIHSLSNVESLKLEFDCPKGMVLKKDFSHCPVFNNLKRLELLNWGLFDFDLAPFFILYSPKLQEITFGNYIAWAKVFSDEEITQEERRDALVIQREFLKTVRILGNDDLFVDRLINKLLVHVKIIGEIITDQQEFARKEIKEFVCYQL